MYMIEGVYTMGSSGAATPPPQPNPGPAPGLYTYTLKEQESLHCTVLACRQRARERLLPFSSCSIDCGGAPAQVRLCHWKHFRSYVILHESAEALMYSRLSNGAPSLEEDVHFVTAREPLKQSVDMAWWKYVGGEVSAAGTVTPLGNTCHQLRQRKRAWEVLGVLARQTKFLSP